MIIDLSSSKATEFEIYLVQGNILIYADKKLFIDRTLELENRKSIEFHFNKEIKVNHVISYNRMSNKLRVDIEYHDIDCGKLDIYDFSNGDIWLLSSKVDFLKMYNSSILSMNYFFSNVNHMFATVFIYCTSYDYSILEVNASYVFAIDTGDDEGLEYYEMERDNITLLIGNEWCSRIESNSIIDYISPYIL